MDIGDIKVMRATEEWQRAGAYYVRIETMARKYHITLRAEFDKHDGADAKYIVLLDHDFPVATSRWFPTDEETAEIGRIVVLPGYQKKGLGRLVLCQTEKWLREEGYRKAVLNSRINAIRFYEKAGYISNRSISVNTETFECVYMEKML